MDLKHTDSETGSMPKAALSVKDSGDDNTSKSFFRNKYFEKMNKKVTDYKDWTARTIVTHTLTHCCVNWCTILLLTAIVIGGNFISIHEIQFNDFMLLSEKDVQNFFALDEAQGQISAGLSEDIAFRSQASFFVGILTLYEVEEGKELVTPENLQLICQVEKLFIDEPDYPLFCQTAGPNLGLDTECLPQENSIAEAFYQNNLTSCELLDQAVIDLTLQFFRADPENNGGLLFLNNLENPTIARSNLKIGTPLGDDSPPFRNFSIPVISFQDDEAKEGHSIIQVEYADSLLEFFEVEHNPPLQNAYIRPFFTKDTNPDLQVRFYSFLIDEDHLSILLTFDQLYVGGSFIFVLVYVWIYVRSFFLACATLTSITFTMVIGLFFYAVVLQINYFTTIHVISFFIILAVGANNFYVIVDAWRQSKNIIEDEIKEEKEEQGTDYLENEAELTIVRRMKYSYSRAALSVFNTSMTTFIAFAANLVSPISVIAGFGLFSGIVVLVNFLFMLNVHPTHLMIYHKYIRHVQLPCCYLWNKIKEKKKRASEILDTEVDETKLDKSVGEERGAPDKDKWYVRARSYYIYLINYTLFPYAALVFTVSLGIGLSTVATRLETPTTPETLYQDSHIFANFIVDFNGEFTEGSDDTFTLVHGVFGIDGLDRSNVQFLDASQFSGTATFDPNFNFFSQTTQDYIIDYCDIISTEECFEDGCTIDTLILPDTIECTMLAFRDFFEATTGSRDSFTTFSNNTLTGFTEEEILELLGDFVQAEQGFSDKVGLIDGEIKFIAISFRQSMNIDQPLITKAPVLDIFNAVSKRIVDEAPEEGLETFFHTSFDLTWQHTERGLVSGLFIGMAVSLGASYIIVLFGTRNVFVSFFAISGVAAIVGCVLGTAQSLGFELGTTEAIAGVMVIGLAVDYIVHLGYMFIKARSVLAEEVKDEESEEKKEQLDKKSVSNRDQIKFAVEKMMFTILAGGFTTFSAGFVLFACTLSFFLKMALLIMFTSLYSVMFAFFYFVPLLRIFGPGKR